MKSHLVVFPQWHNSFLSVVCGSSHQDFIVFHSSKVYLFIIFLLKKKLFKSRCYSILITLLFFLLFSFILRLLNLHFPRRDYHFLYFNFSVNSVQETVHIFCLCYHMLLFGKLVLGFTVVYLKICLCTWSSHTHSIFSLAKSEGTIEIKIILQVGSGLSRIDIEYAFYQMIYLSTMSPLLSMTWQSSRISKEKFYFSKSRKLETFSIQVLLVSASDIIWFLIKGIQYFFTA